MVITKTHKIFAAFLVSTVILYACLGFYLLPFLVMKKLPAILQEKTGQPAKLEAFRLNPFSFEMEMDGFSLASGESKNLVSFAVFAVNFNAWESVRRLTIVFDTIELKKPVFNIKRETDGRFNFTSMIPKSTAKPEAPQKPAGPPPPLTIHNLEIDNGEFNWLDLSKGQPQKALIQPINLKIADLTTEINGTGNFDFGFDLASGGQLHWRGQLSLEPLKSSGILSLEQLNLGNIWKEFLQPLLPVAIPEGSLSIQADYEANTVDNHLALTIKKGEIALSNLKITENNLNQPLVTIPSLVLHGIEADIPKNTIKAAALESKDVLIKAALERDGRINYQRLFIKDGPQTEQSAPNPAPVSATKESDWQINLAELGLKNYQLQFTDQTRSPPQQTQISKINFNLQKFAFPQTEKLPVQFDAIINKDGQIKINGDLGLTPVSAVLAIDMRSIKLKALQDYLDDYLKLDLIDGELSLNGNLSMLSAETFQLRFQGDADIANLLTRDKIIHKDFLKWSDLSFQKMDVDLAKQSFNLAKIQLDNPYLRVTIEKDRSTNFNEILVSKSVANETPVKQKPAEKPKDAPLINISKIELNNGSSDFSDLSLIMPFITEMDELNGEVDGFASNQNTPLKIGLKGKVYHMAVVNINGSYQLNSNNSDISLKFNHMPLPLITPYMADFAGYKIEKGQMALDLQYTINEGQLNAQNKIFIDQLTLGDQVENPHATSLPLKLAIALLKDADGKINLDFPITGSLNDPEFSVGSLIVDVIENLITKLVSSPFRALGGLLSDDQDYSTVKFAPGSAEIAVTETEKLDQLSKALQNKPELTLDVKGKSYQNSDWPMIRFEALKEILKKMKSGELRDKGQNIRSEYIELTEDEYKRLLEKFFKEVYPQELDHTLLGKPIIKTQPDADFYEVAKQKLENILQPDVQRLNDLAVARANAISKYLTEKGNIDLARQYFLAPENDTSDTADIVSVLALNVAH